MAITRNFLRTIPGRPSNETADCTVFALATLTNVTWDVANRELGRKTREGVRWPVLASLFGGGSLANPYSETVNCLGSEFTRLPEINWQDQMTLNQFCKKYNVGSYYVIVRGHVLAVIDGVCHDCWTTGARTRVYAAWKVENGEIEETPAPVAAPESTLATPVLPRRTFDRVVMMLQNGQTEYTQKDLAKWNIPASGRKYRAWWGITNTGGKAAAELGYRISMVTVNGEKIIRVTR